jgi:anthranilate synthase component 1
VRIEPPEESFAARHAAGQPQLVWTKLVADLETPVGACLKLARLGAPLFLLESVEGGSTRGRYSMIGLRPDLLWRSRDGLAEIDRDPAGNGGFVAEEGTPLESLRRLVAESRIDLPEGLPPMSAGIFGYLGYDMVRQMERLPEPKPDPVGVPDALLMRPTVMVVFDSVRDELYLLTPARPRPGQGAAAARAAAIERLEEVERALDGAPGQRGPANALALAGPVRSTTTPERYRAMVAQAQEYIRAGDIFQVVLAQRFTAEFPLGGFALYRALRRVNPAPFLCYLDMNGFEIVCSSPEILVRLRDGTVTVRPIAGTRPRGATPAEDEALGKELLADPKERAEHLMLLDLGRNDVGRVAELGSVRVTDRFFLERYSHVMHIVSNVEGRLKAGADAIDALVAGFPAGTVSGAPKVRAMEIIDELETDRRGIYAGCIGYFGADGSMDTCIVLRTAVVKDGTMHVTAGAGIVHDSVPDSEQAECVNKARAQFRAAEEAIRYAGEAGRGQ